MGRSVSRAHERIGDRASEVVPIVTHGRNL